jgi:hypothetical protein
MITLLTKEAISYTRDKVRRSLVPSYPMVGSHLPDKYDLVTEYSLYYNLDPSLQVFRNKVEHFLEELLNIEEGSSKEYILYTAIRSGSRVKIKALPRKIKNIRTLHTLDSLVPVATGEIKPGRKLATAIMDITFLRSLFSLGSACNSIDLSKAALPEDDVRVRVGNYNLLYDKVDKEWSLWMKS